MTKSPFLRTKNTLKQFRINNTIVMKEIYVVFKEYTINEAKKQLFS